MEDKSHIDQNYFISRDTYNCPFCNRNHVKYSVKAMSYFQWSRDREVYYYIIACNDCGNRSLHLSDYEFVSSTSYGFYDIEDVDSTDEDNLDQYFFYHQPTSFFTVDSRIPKVIRELISEADGCMKMNYNVGASGALRKAIYEFLVAQETDESENYENRIKSLKSKHSSINPEYFDVLGNVQGMTSEQLHEQNGDWESWGTKDLAFLIEMFNQLMREIYVIPDERKSQFDKISTLRGKSKAFKLQKKKETKVEKPNDKQDEQADEQ